MVRDHARGAKLSSLGARIASSLNRSVRESEQSCALHDLCRESYEPLKRQTYRSSAT
jgi:hypothetical protein